MKKKETKQPKKTYTEEQMKRIATAIHCTWQAIGYDVLNAVKEAEGKDYVTRDVMIETVCDADYMKAYGLDPEACKWVDEMFDESYDGAFRRLRKLCRFKRYGY
jgi:hypothetical protein